MQRTMMTVRTAADRIGRNPETVRRWIRSGKLRAHKVGAQQMIDEADLDQIAGNRRSLPMPEAWRKTWTGEPQPDWVRILRGARLGR